MQENRHCTESGQRAFDVCIVGGGMVGLTLAQLMAAELPELRLALIEKHGLTENTEMRASSFDNRSTALSMGSVEIFSALQLWTGLRERATAISSVEVSDKGHIGATTFSANDNGGKELGYVVENAWLGHCLQRNLPRFQNLARIAPAEVKAAKMLAEGVSLRVVSSANQASSDIFADLVIIADGLDSRMREHLGIELDVKNYDQRAIIANVEFTEAHQGRAFERFTEAGPLALLPLGDARKSALVYTRPESVFATSMSLDDDRFLQDIQKAFGYRLGRFTRVGKRFAYPLSLSIAREQVRSSIVLVGNAAHFLHPVAGQGFNLALRDVTQLLSVLQTVYKKRGLGVQQRYGDLKLLKRYLEIQENDQYLTGFLSDSFNSIFSSRNLLKRGGRNIGLLGLELCDGLKKSVFHRMMGESLPKARLEIFH